MMIELPSNLWLFRRYALLVSETKVYLVSWKKGTFRLIGGYVNDTQGLDEFASFVQKNRKLLENKSINVVVNLIGEDYRFEKVAHLVGKFKTDMIRKKYQQLFRGITFSTYLSQGREAIGRRLDLMLFIGILGDEKLSPWIKEIGRVGMALAGVLPSSLVAATINSKIMKDTSGCNVVSYMVEDNFIRHCFYVDGHLRFSRVSRVPPDIRAADLYKILRLEVEKTSTYLTSVKILQQNAKIVVHLVCADDLRQTLDQVVAQSDVDRISVRTISAQGLCNSLGIKRQLIEFGRDSSPILHTALRSLYNPLNTMAPFQMVRYSLARLLATLVGCVYVGWTALVLLGVGLDVWDGYNNYSSKNIDLAVRIEDLRKDYQNQVSLFENPPSSPANMSAAVNTLDGLVKSDYGPGKLLLFTSKLLDEAIFVIPKDLEWYISNETGRETGRLAALSGLPVYNILRVAGVLDPESDPEIGVEQFNRMIRIIRARKDMSVTILRAPRLLESGREITGRLDSEVNVRSLLNTYEENSFEILIAWRDGGDQDSDKVAAANN